jgi:hypothetical protein
MELVVNGKRPGYVQGYDTWVAAAGRVLCPSAAHCDEAGRSPRLYPSDETGEMFQGLEQGG